MGKVGLIIRCLQRVSRSVFPQVFVEPFGSSPTCGTIKMTIAHPTSPHQDIYQGSSAYLGALRSHMYHPPQQSGCGWGFSNTPRRAGVEACRSHIYIRGADDPLPAGLVL